MSVHHLCEITTFYSGSMTDAEYTTLCGFVLVYAGRVILVKLLLIQT